MGLMLWLMFLEESEKPEKSKDFNNYNSSFLADKGNGCTTVIASEVHLIF